MEALIRKFDLGFYIRYLENTKKPKSNQELQNLLFSEYRLLVSEKEIKEHFRKQYEREEEINHKIIEKYGYTQANNSAMY